MLRINIRSTVILVLVAGLLPAQHQDISGKVKTAMKKLEVLSGEWQGESWQMTPQHTRQEATVHEKLQWKLDQTLLLIEGRAENVQGEPVHNAFALVYYDPYQKKYGMQSHLADGGMTEANFEILSANQFRWQLNMGSQGYMRYTMTITDGSKWKEIGEYSRDGENWQKTFEMNLTRIN